MQARDGEVAEAINAGSCLCCPEEDSSLRESSTGQPLITRRLFESTGHHAISRGLRVNIMESATDPGISARMRIRGGRSAKRGEDINHRGIITGIGCQMSIERLYSGNRSRTEILIRVVVVHQQQIAGHLSI